MGSIKRSTRVLMALAAIAVAAVAVPAGASAHTGELDWEYKHSWYDYVHVDWPGPYTPDVHDVIATSGATETSTRVFNHGIDATNSDYNPFASSGLAAYDGKVASQNDAHGILVSFEDPQIDVSGSAATLSAVTQYRPLGGGGPTTPARIDVATFTGLTRSLSGTTSTWTDEIPLLTAAGAAAFNGGAHGSYSAGDPFGAVDFEITP